MATFDDLARERYISLETFKKDGNGVKTPVWVAGLDGKLVIVTDGTSYKVKRMRNNPKVRIAPCDGRGNVRGGASWTDGEGRVVVDASFVERAHRALKDKYGWQFWFLDLGSKLSGRIGRRAYLEITV